MSRTEYRVSYQVYRDGEPMGRVWRHICHTRQKTIDFIKMKNAEAGQRNRQLAIVQIDYRPTGRWQPWNIPLDDLMGD